MEIGLTFFKTAEELSAKKIFSVFQNQTEKRFGQNFLFDEKINRKIVYAAGDLTNRVVMEVGPGPGGITLEILKHPIKKLYVVEFDPRWAKAWRELSNLFDRKLEVVECDALQFDEQQISPQVIISNLPYNISSPLLFKWLRSFDKFEKLVLMFQKEVAERLFAPPNTKSYGKLSIMAQWKSSVEKVLDLEPGSFFPPPKVSSTIVKFIPYPYGEDFQNFDKFSQLLNTAFLHRRKIVISSLKKFNKNIPMILANFNYPQTVRAEEISVSDYIRLMKLLNA